MDINPIFFGVFATIAIAASLLVVFKRNPVASAFSLIVVFFAFAAIYAMLGAHLLAALQILVYAGAIMVLFVFVIMLLNADTPSFDLGRTHVAARGAAVVAAVVLFGFLAYVLRNSAALAPTAAYTAAAIEGAGGNTRVISELMFSEYILPFELTSVLLLAAIVGAVAMAKRKVARGYGETVPAYGDHSAAITKGAT